MSSGISASSGLTGSYGEHLSSKSNYDRLRAAQQLGKEAVFGAELSFPHALRKQLTKALNDDEPDVRTAAATTLIKFGARAVDALAAEIKSDADEAGPCAFVLKKIGSAAVPELQRMLQDVDGTARLKAVLSCGVLGRSAVNVVPELLKMVDGDMDP